MFPCSACPGKRKRRIHRPCRCGVLDKSPHNHERQKMKKTSEKSAPSGIQTHAMKPECARRYVAKIGGAVLAKNPEISGLALRQKMAVEIVRRFSNAAACAGVASTLYGVLPGASTSLWAVYGLLNATKCRIVLANMATCLVVALRGDLADEEVIALASLLARSETLETEIRLSWAGALPFGIGLFFVARKNYLQTQSGGDVAAQFLLA